MQNNTSVEVASILEALRAEVRARRQFATDERGEQSALDRQLERCVEQLEITRVVSAHWPLNGGTLVERGWVLVHKVVRRYLRWYINPIVEQQNAFNDVAARTLRLLVEAYAEVRAQSTQVQGGGDESSLSGVDSPSHTSHLDPSNVAVLQALVQQQATTEPPAPLGDLQLLSLPRLLHERQTVSAHWELMGATPLERGRAFSQRLLRQYLRWMINPIVEQQNSFNAALTAMIPSMIAADAEARGLLAGIGHRRQKAKGKRQKAESRRQSGSGSNVRDE